MATKEELQAIIEKAAINKEPIHIDITKGQYFKTTLLSDNKFLVEELFWRDERGHVYRAILEPRVIKNNGLNVCGMYIFGNYSLDGFGSGRTDMFREKNRCDL